MAGEAWSRMSLGKFVTLQRGHDLPDERRRPGRVPILGSFGITGWHDEAKARGPGVTVGRSGASFGVVSYSTVDYWPLNTALYVIDFHGNDPRFVYYFLKTFDFKGYNSGSAQPSLNRNFVHPVPIDVPPYDEQRAIAHILGTLDDKIELNRRMNETLEAMARALFKSWFVDFDPVRAKAEGRDTGLPKAIADLFPDSFEDSEMGEIQRGWKAGKVSDLCDAIYSGGTPCTRKPEYWNGDIPWLSSGETRERFVIDTEKLITPAGVSNSSTRLAPAMSTVIAGAGQGNTRGQTSLLTINSYVNQSVVVLMAKAQTSSPYHLFFDLERRYEEFRRISDAHSSRGTFYYTHLLRTNTVMVSISR